MRLFLINLKWQPYHSRRYYSTAVKLQKLVELNCKNQPNNKKMRLSDGEGLSILFDELAKLKLRPIAIQRNQREFSFDIISCSKEIKYKK